MASTPYKKSKRRNNKMADTTKCGSELDLTDSLTVVCDLEKGHQGSHISASTVTNEDISLKVNILWQPE
jgi:hypothetical protein